MGFRNNICAAIDETSGKTVYTQEIETTVEYRRLPFVWKTDNSVEQKVWEYRPLLVGTLLLIAKHIELLPSDVANIEKPNEVINLTSQQSGTLIYIIAAAIQNNCKEPANNLIAKIRNSFSAEDIADGMLLVYKAANLSSILSAINIVKGTEKILVPKEIHD